MANLTYLTMPSDGGYSLNLQVPTLTGTLNVVFPVSTGTVTLMNLGAAGEMTGPVKINAVGGGTPVTLTNNGLMVYGTSAAAGYVQMGVQNLTSTGSSDLVVTADNGNDSGGYVSVGINNSTYSSVTWTVNGARDGYVSINGGHLAIGTDTAAKDVVIYTGGGLLANIRAKFSDSYSAVYLGGTAGAELRLGGVMWQKVATLTLSSWTTAASCLGNANTGTGTLTIKANTLKVHSKIIIRIIGQITDTSAAPTMTVAVKLNSTQIATSSAFSLQAGSQTYTMETYIELGCSATGVSGKIRGRGHWMFTNTTYVGWLPPISGTEATIDTTIDQAIDVTVACSANSASNTWSVEQVDIIYLPAPA